MKTTMKSYRMDEIALQNIEDIKNMLNEMYGWELNNTDVISRALDSYRGLVIRLYDEREHLV